MKWIKFKNELPPPYTKVLVACGVISVENYRVLSFNKNNLHNANPNSSYCSITGHNSDGLNNHYKLIYWCYIDEPVNNYT